MSENPSPDALLIVRSRSGTIEPDSDKRLMSRSAVSGIERSRSTDPEAAFSGSTLATKS